MNSRRQIIKLGIAVLIVVLLGMMLTHCTNTAETKSVKSDKTTEKSKKKVTTKRPGKNKSIDVDKSSSQEKNDKVEVSNNDSNVSESKKDNTASSTNTNSNKNNTSSSKPSNSGSNNSGTSKPSNNSGSNSSNSKPAEHTHNWVAQYKTVNVPEKGHNEQVLVQAAYDEQVPITEMRAHDICNQCGADLTGTDIPAHMENSYLNGGNCGGHHTEWRETVVGYKTVHHDAVYETRYVVDSPATTKQELTGYKCSGCGKTRSN